MEEHIQDLLCRLADKLGEKLQEIGGNPMDAGEVHAFVEGCKIEDKLKKMIRDAGDAE